MTPNRPTGADLDSVESSPTGDADFEALAAYLDEELSPGEAAALEQRLRTETSLSDALRRMSDGYALRRAVWGSLEPSSTAAEGLATAALRSARRGDARRRFARIGRIVGSVAACVAVSFCAGWIGRGYVAGRVAGEGARSETANVMPAYNYEVALTDPAGNITAVQKFDSEEEARAFAVDVGRWQARQQELRQAEAARSSVVMTSGL